MINRSPHHRCRPGFTLIELSIVLVIIGLLAGGVLVGRDLITAAQVRQIVSQLERFNTATNTFQLKYNCLPGDCATATQFSFTNNGNGNGQIIGTTTSNGETIFFWTHLWQSQLLTDVADTSSGYTGACGGIPGVNSPTSPLVKRTGQSCVQTPLLGGWWLLWQSASTSSPAYLQDVSGHLFYLGPCATLGCNVNGGDALKPADAFAVDNKIDDGLPETGNFRAIHQGIGVGYLRATSYGATGSASCVNNSVTPKSYNVNNNNYFCSLAVKAAF